MAIQKNTKTVAAPVRNAAPARQAAPVRNAAPARQAAPARGAQVRSVGGFTVLSNVPVPEKKQFGRRGSVYSDLFSQMQPGECVEIPVEENKKTAARMNGLYNAARRSNADITIRVHEPGQEGFGGVFRMWYNGEKAQS